MTADDPDPPDERGRVAESDSSRSNSAFEFFYRQRWVDAARWSTALCGNVHRGEDIAQAVSQRSLAAVAW